MVTVVEKIKEKQKLSKGQGIINPLRPRLLALKDAATYLGRTSWGMRELIWAGKVPIVRDGKKIYFDVADLNSYIERNKSTYT